MYHAFFEKKKNGSIWQIYRSIGIYNVRMYHEYNIVWFNTVVYARILRFFTTSRYGTAIYFDIKFLAPEASRGETATETVPLFYRVRISIA